MEKLVKILNQASKMVFFFLQTSKANAMICTHTFKNESSDGAMSDSGAGEAESTSVNSNFFISSLAMSSLALSDGWYSSQNTYLLLSPYGVDADGLYELAVTTLNGGDSDKGHKK